MEALDSLVIGLNASWLLFRGHRHFLQRSAAQRVRVGGSIFISVIVVVVVVVVIIIVVIIGN